jgi:hypothetical protein
VAALAVSKYTKGQSTLLLVLRFPQIHASTWYYIAGRQAQDDHIIKNLVETIRVSMIRPYCKVTIFARALGQLCAGMVFLRRKL